MKEGTPIYVVHPIEGYVHQELLIFLLILTNKEGYNSIAHLVQFTFLFFKDSLYRERFSRHSTTLSQGFPSSHGLINTTSYHFKYLILKSVCRTKLIRLFSATLESENTHLKC